MKKTAMFRLAVGAAIAILSISACSKDDEKEDLIETQKFLPVSIIDANTNLCLDSFVFNNDQMLQSIYVDQDESRTWATKYNFSYDNDGKCNKVYVYNDRENALSYTDFVEYHENKMMIIHVPEGSNYKDTTTYEMNGNLALISGSKDTVYRDANTKELSYAEYNYSNGLLTSMVDMYDYTTTNYYSHYDYTYQYTYEDKPNAFHFAFTTNPFFYLYFILHQQDFELPFGNKNFKELSVLSNNISDGEESEQETTVYTFTNTYDNNTGLLSKQVINNGSEDVYNLKFEFKAVE